MQTRAMTSSLFKNGGDSFIEKTIRRKCIKFT